MHQSNDIAKTLGPRSARLIVGLYEADRDIFDLDDVCRISGLSKASARSLVRKLVQRGHVARLKPGLFRLVPLQLGAERQYVGDPYTIASELARGDSYYISHASAMDIHGMLTQPQLIVYVTMLKPRRPLIIHGSEFRFLRTKKEHFFGLTQHWVDKQHRVSVSDLEKTVIDGLKQSHYCGGFSEIAKGFWMRRMDMSIDRMVEYALRLEIGVVARRLGFMLELFGFESPAVLTPLLAHARRPYLMLDPLLPDEGKFVSRWKLRANIDPAEILLSVRT